MKRISLLIGRERGQALIEFVMIAPLMFLFLFAIVDFAIAIDRRVVLQHAVREGARYGAVHDDCGEILQRTFAQAQGIEDVLGTVSYEDRDDANTEPGNVGDAVKVEARLEWNFPILSEMAGVFGLDPGVTLNPEGFARLERTVSDTTGCTSNTIPVPTVPPP